jgi:hypothetical protein
MPGAMVSHHVKWMLYQQLVGILQFSNVGREHLSHFVALGKGNVTVGTMIIVIHIRRNTASQKFISKMMY